MSFMSYINSLATHNGRIGKIGEDFAVEHLESLGHTVIERNFKNKYGEIDIITSTIDPRGVDVKFHVIEVKTSQSMLVRAEENMNPKKMKKVALLGQMYCKDKLYSIDFIGVSLNPNSSLKEITYLENLEIY